MKINLILLFYLISSVLLRTEVYSQRVADSLDQKAVYCFAGLGYKYHVTKTAPFPDPLVNAYNNHFVINLGVNADLWGGQNNFIGIDILGYPYKYGDTTMKPKFFTLISNVFYKRNIHFTDKVALCPAVGFSIFSNDPVHIGTIYIDIGGSYDLESYELFVKNSFRLAMPFLFKNAPFFLTAGCAIKI